MKKVFQKPIKLKDSKVKGTNASQRQVITLTKRSAEELSKSRCAAYAYLIP